MKKKMKIVVASGKGGVGKSMLASCLAMLFAESKQVVAIDADVDAPNLHLWLGLSFEAPPAARAKEEEEEKSTVTEAMVDKWDKVEKISTNELPIIDLKKCTGCGKCAEICAFGALSFTSEVEGVPMLHRGDTSEVAIKKPILNRFFCEGCGACEVVCPVKAIKMEKFKNGEIRIKKSIQGFPLVSAQLYPGQTGSGKIVDLIKKRAEEFKHELMMIDSPAGTGCPVIAALNGTNFAVLVTEPTPSGLADLKRVLTVVNHFKIPYRVVINKWDINPSMSNRIKKEFENHFLGQISYDKRVFQAIADLKPILKTNLKAKTEIEKIFKRLEKEL